ncbi:MAG TPA: urease accessory UreF family protein, partial [Prosthecobacter sp.]
DDMMKRPHLTSLILLPPPQDTKLPDVQIIEDWARGLDWVKWLLGSVRARTSLLMVAGKPRPVHFAWADFAEGLLPDTLGPALKEAWECAQAGDLEGLMAVDAELSASLPPELSRRSLQSGAVLLKSTQHARYQAVLGRYREAVADGRSAGNIAVVWAAVGHFFQLSLANVIAEYLHLEWDIATRDAPWMAKPKAQLGVTALTGMVMRGSMEGAGLKVVEG